MKLSEVIDEMSYTPDREGMGLVFKNASAMQFTLRDRTIERYPINECDVLLSRYIHLLDVDMISHALADDVFNIAPFARRYDSRHSRALASATLSMVR